MIDVLRSEWIKLRTVRMNAVLVIIGIAFPLIVTVLTTALIGDGSSFDGGDLVELVTGTGIVTALLLGVIGAAGITGEFGFNTIRPTFAAVPRRGRVISAKAIVTVVTSALVQVVVLAVAYGVGGAVLSGRDRGVSFDDAPAASAALLGAVVFAALVSLLGYGLGLLLRSTPAAVAVLILWPLLAENLVAGILIAAGVEDATRWLPFNNGFRLAALDPGNDGLSRLGSGLYFGAVVAVIVGIGSFVTNRRDA